MRKRLLALLFMLALTLSGCGGTAEKNPDPDTPDTEPEAEVTDFYGQTFIITSPWIQYMNPRFMYKDDVLTVDQEKLQAWWQKAQEDLNCVFESADKVDATTLQSAVAAGTHYTDIIYVTGSDMYTYAKAGLLVNLSEAANIDVTDAENWNQDITATLGTYNHTCYGVQRANSYGGIRGGVLAYNEKYMNEFSLESPYEYLEQKNWTFDVFADMLSRAADTDPEHTVYALSSCNTVSLGRAAVIANGAKIITDNNTFGYTEPAALSALDWLSKITSDPAMFATAGNTDAFFAHGGSTFSHDETWLHLSPYEYCSSMNDITYYLIRFPYGPDAEYGSFAPSFNSDTDQIYSIAACTEDVDDTAYVLTYYRGTKQYYKTYPEYKDIEENWENEYFSKQSYDEYQYCRKYLQLAYPYELKEVNTVIETAIKSTLNGSKSAQEAMSAIKDKVEAYIPKD